MRASNLLWQCAALAGTATASSDAYLWTVDTGATNHGSNQVSTTSSSTAERIIARRKGVTESAYLYTTDETVLSDLNTYGGYQQPIFGAGSKEAPAKVFIRISGYDKGILGLDSGCSFANDVVAVSEFNTLPDLWIEDAETSLVDTFEAKFDLKDTCEYHIKPRMREGVSIKYTYQPKVRPSAYRCSSAHVLQSQPCKSQREIEMLPSILAISSTVPTADKLAGKGISSFHRTLLHLSSTENLESTLLVLPTESKLKKSKKTHSHTHKNTKRAEAPLDLPTAAASDSFPQLDIFASNSSNMTLPKFVPQCFSTMDACTNTTNNCSGHGKCREAHKGCFKCKCGSTIVRTNEDGTTKSVQWGGNACQKKDISVQFILFASFGIFFTALVAGSIGMLFNMGGQELPSVIGAGVVGPRAQK